MLNPLATKLSQLAGFKIASVEELEFGPRRNVAAHHDILSHGADITHTTLLLSGMAFRYKVMGEGCRAIIGFLVPGDFTNPMVPSRQRLDYAVGTLTTCEVVDVPCRTLQALAELNPQLAEALWLSFHMDAAIQRDWTAIVSQFSADKRVANLLCEIRRRLELVGLADRKSLPLPLRQQDLADAMGLSVVHVNRVMQDLRHRELIRTGDRTVFIPDLDQLEAFAGYDAGTVPKMDPPGTSQSMPAVERSIAILRSAPQQA
jgi:CRP-like cAMP-binding protein